MDKEVFTKIFKDFDVIALKMLTYQAMIMRLRNGGGTVADLERLVKLEQYLGIDRLVEAA